MGARVFMNEESEVVSFLNEGVLDIVNDIFVAADMEEECIDSFDEYDRDLVNEAISNLKKKKLMFFVGRVAAYLDTLRFFDSVSIEKSAYNFLRHVEDKYILGVK